MTVPTRLRWQQFCLKRRWICLRLKSVGSHGTLTALRTFSDFPVEVRVTVLLIFRLSCLFNDCALVGCHAASISSYRRFGTDRWRKWGIQSSGMLTQRWWVVTDVSGPVGGVNEVFSLLGCYTSLIGSNRRFGIDRWHKWGIKSSGMLTQCWLVVTDVSGPVGGVSEVFSLLVC